MKVRPVLLLFWIACLCLGGISLYAQPKCQISVSAKKGCKPLPDSCKVKITNLPVGVKSSSFVWDFGDKTNSSQKDSVVHIFTQRGAFVPKVTIKFSDGSTCTSTLTYPVNIYDNPVSFFNITTDSIVLCQLGDLYCFKSGAKRGKDNAPLNKYIWDFRDGTPPDTGQSPCHFFPRSGKYLATLSVKDTNNCANLYQKALKVFIFDPAGRLSPDFKDSLFFSCNNASTRVYFKNLTDTAGKWARKFVWDFGDGIRDSCYLNFITCRKKWDAFSHTYLKAGSYYPKLYVENQFGCRDSFLNPKPVEILNYKLKISVQDSVICYDSLGRVSFFANIPPVPSPFCIWDFGDSASKFDNKATSSWNPRHRYMVPGTFTITFSETFDSCQLDTILCKKVVIYGPVARIMNDTALDRIPALGVTNLVPTKKYPSFFDTCLSSVNYYTRDSSFIKNGDTTFGSYCNATLLGYKKRKPGINKCDGSFERDSIPIYKRSAVSTKDTSVISWTKNTWFKGDSLPKGMIYSGLPFQDRPLIWNDTDMYNWRCGPPKLVKFTNFSYKYRGYDAIDNFAPGEKDTCNKNYNPNYPYASDSLEYLWEFHEGLNDTSTTKKPNIRARVSTEKVPEHLFLDSGCYYVVLTVRDMVTGCKSVDQIPIVVQAPLAGWDKNIHPFDNMTWKRQLQRDYLPRRGVILEGLPCTNSPQDVNMTETRPGCVQRYFDIVLDSLLKVPAMVCNQPDSSKMSWDWTKNPLQIFYADTGWKTMGVAVSTNPYCKDTAWYHNYKYFYSVDPKIAIDAKIKCPGDPFKFALLNQQQKAIKFVVLRYVYIDQFGKRSDAGIDTFRYKTFKNNLGVQDSATSSMNNPTVDLYDTSYFNFLTDTIKHAFPKTGHIHVYSAIYNRVGCMDFSDNIIAIGHTGDYFIKNQVLCVGDTASPWPQVMYNLNYPRDTTRDPRKYWRDPIGIRGGRIPKYIEKIKWDMDGDGIIDDTTFSPHFVYKKVGNYSIKMYTKDSLDCDWLLTEKKNYIKVISVKADFVVHPPGPDRFCNPQYFRLKSTSQIIDSVLPGQQPIKIEWYHWDFGDGTPALISKKDSIQNSIVHNGNFPVKLTVFTSTGTGYNGKGCTDEATKPLNIEGPQPKFKIIGDTMGCVPFTLKVVDLSKKTTFKDWHLGDSTVVSTTNKDTVYLVYRKVGIFCPSLIGASQITDSNNVKFFCSDTFPYKHCQFQVKVTPHPKVGLTSDTIVCLGEPFTFTDASDTSFKTIAIDYGDSSPIQNMKLKGNISHTYNKTGYFNVVYRGTGPYCPDTLIRRLQVIKVKADFVIDSTRSDTPTFTFLNRSKNATGYIWTYGDASQAETLYNIKDVSHRYTNTGEFEICLEAFNKQGCRDKICKKINLGKYIFIPNVFTPANKDGFNDNYVIEARGEQKYYLQIFNRWGQKVFESEDKTYTWNGTKFNKNDTECPAGTYYFLFQYQLLGEEVKKVEGTVTLIR